MKLTTASVGAKNPEIAAASASRYVTSAVASFNRLSPSRIVTIRLGTPMRCRIEVAATASGGATIAPNANASGHPREGISTRAAAATVPAVASTRPTARSPIARAFVL